VRTHALRRRLFLLFDLGELLLQLLFEAG
jgi:hypothetical protein